MIPLLITACASKSSPLIAEVDEDDDVYFEFIQADLLGMEGKTRKSTKELRKLIEKDPDVPFYYFLLAQNYGRGRKLSEAITTCKKAIEIFPDFFLARVYLGRLYSTNKEHEKSVTIFRGVIGDGFDDEDVYIYLAREYVALEEYGRAIKTLKKLLKINPDSVLAHVFLGSIYDQRLDNPRLALNSYRTAVAIEPGNVDAHYAMAQIYLRENQQKRALAKFQEILKLTPDDLAVQLRVALIYYELKDYSKAIAEFKKVLKRNPDADKIKYYLGILYESREESDAALDAFYTVPPNSSFYMEARLHIVNILRKDERNADAEVSLMDAIDERNDVPEFYEFMAAIYEEGDNYPAAEKILERGRRKLPHNEKVVFLLAIVRERMNDKKGAISAMREVLEINPQNAAALNYIGYSYAESGKRLDEAREMIEKALVIKPNDGYITDSLGWTYYRAGDYGQAMKYLKRADHLAPNEPTILDHIANVLMKMGDGKSALKYFRRAYDGGLRSGKLDKDHLEEINEKIEELSAE